MSIAVTREQQELAAAARGFVARHASAARTREQFDRLASGGRPDHWPALVRQGLHAVHLPEDDGGQGGGLPELAVVLEQVGRGLLPGPYVPTATTGAVLVRLPPSARRSAFLAELAGGATATVVEPGEISGEVTATGWTLTGGTRPVLGLPGADVLLVGVTEESGTRWFRVDPEAGGVRRPALEGVDLTRDLGRLDLDGVAVSPDADLGLLDAEVVRSVTTALSAAEAAGVMGWCVAAAVEYAKVREQFGRPIGSFQAVKHKLARMFVAAELAAATAWDAVRSLDESLEQQRLAVGSAAVMALGRAVDTALEAIMVFGGIGFTWEHDAHLYWRRAMSLAALTGDAGTWLTRVGEVATTTRRESDVALLDADPAFRARVAGVLDRVLALPEDPMGGTGRPVGPRRTALADAGLVAPHWPEPWGLAANPLQQLVIAEEFARRGIPQPSMVIGDWAMPTILAHGTAQQVARFARATLVGETVWCQLFSEPGAGSDLAGLATKAVKADAGWRLTGQKVWTSAAHEADWAICLARTDAAAPRHKGLTYFLVDMHAPGIRVRPLRQANGEARFNEVFLDDVFVPDDCLVGTPGDGWRLAMTTLGNERMTIGSTMSGREGEVIRELIANGGHGASRAEAVRSLGRVQAYGTAVAALAARETLLRLEGRQPGATASVGKVASAQLHREAAAAAFALVGPEAAARGGPVDVADVELNVPGRLLGGGTTEIQLNVIAERVLGLPRG